MALSFITYHLLLDHSSQRKIPSIAAYAFFDGNYMYEKGLDYREGKISELNLEGTEFRYVDLLKTDNEFNFSLKDPSYVLHKYIWGLNKITKDMTFSVLPGGNIAKSKFLNIGPDGGKVFYSLMGNGWDGILKEVSRKEVQVNPDIHLKKDAVRKAAGGDFDKVWHILQQSLSSRMRINIIFQGTFLFLLMISGAYYKWHFKMMHILFFTVGVLLIPFCNPAGRYLISFLPLYFVLWLFGRFLRQSPRF